MNSRDITLYLDERWCDALEATTGRKVEALLQERLGELIQQLPPAVRLPIEADIQLEEQQRAAEQEANRHFAVFRLTESGESRIFLVEHREYLSDVAAKLRQYTHAKAGQTVCLYPDRRPLTLDGFERYSAEMLCGSVRVTGVYDIDMDKGVVSTLEAEDGWHRYRIKDVSTAAYYANRDQSKWWERTDIFNARLEGKELTDRDRTVFIRGNQPLPVDNLGFEEDVEQMEHLLNFYVPVYLDPDAVFGTHINTDENDDNVNLYADYDMERGCVCDTLEVYLMRADGSEVDCAYRLTPEEQAALLPKMDAYCKENLGLTLAQAREQYMAEQMSDTPIATTKQERQGPIMEQTM